MNSIFTVSKKQTILHICVPLVIGAINYLVFRPDTIISKTLLVILRCFGINNWNVPDIHLPVWLCLLLRNYIGDMLWAYSLMFAVNSVLKMKPVIPFLIAVQFAIWIEVAQRIGFLSGTFDYWDILLEVLAASAALTIIIEQRRRK